MGHADATAVESKSADVTRVRKAEAPSALIEMSQQYLDSPAHFRLLADYLAADGMVQKACECYNKATNIYLEQGKVLKAMAVKLAMWRVSPPCARDVYQITGALKRIESGGNALIKFLSQLGAEELGELFSQMEYELVPAACVLLKPGQVFNHLYLVASGSLKDSLFVSVEDAQRDFRNPTTELGENDYFGEIYPFDAEIPSKSYFEAIGPVEVIKIGKNSLRRLCGKFSNFEVGLLKLCKVRSGSADLDPRSLRRTKRLKMGVALDLLIEWKSDAGKPIQMKGWSQDISVDGICTVLDAKSYAGFTRNDLAGEIKGTTVKIAAGHSYLKVFFSGRIAWWHFISHKGQKTVALGIQLNTLPPNYKGILMSFLSLIRDGADVR